MLRRHPAAICSLLALLSVSCHAPLLAQAPISADYFEAPAIAAMLPESAPVYAAAVKDLQAAQQGLSAIITAHGNGEAAFGRLAPGVFTQTRAAILGLRWEAPWLMHLGEPAGFELDRRSLVMNAAFRQFASIYRSGSKGAAFNQKASQAYSRNAKMRDAAYQRAAKLVEQGQMEAAETFVLATIRSWVNKDLGLLDSYAQYVGGFQPSINVFRDAMANSRKELGARAFASLRNKAMPQADATASIQDQVAAVSSGEVAGPTAFDAMARVWKVSHWQLSRAESAELGRLGVLQQAASPELEAIRSRRQALPVAISNGLAEVVSADLAKASSESLQHYLQASARLSADARPGVLDQLEQALLDYSVQVHGEPARQLDGALSELLVWRQRSAEARAARYMTQGYAALQVTLASAQSTANVKGLYPADGRAGPMFDGCAPEILGLLDAKGKQVALNSVCAPSTASQQRATQIADRAFASLPRNWDVAAPVARLEADLLVNSGAPPISLGPAAAIMTAKSGAFERVGGTVQRVHCKSLLEVQHGLPAASWNLVPLGNVLETISEPYGPQAAIHVELAPEWLQHRHFVAPVQTTPGTPPRS